MKQWGVFTNFYNGITIDNRNVAIDFLTLKIQLSQKLFMKHGNATDQFRKMRSHIFMESLMRRFHTNISWNILQRIVMS